VTASHPAPAHVLSRVAPSFLAADVGGTHVRVARAQASGDEAHPVQLLEYRKYRNADYAGLSAILTDFLGDSARPSQCVVATAGFAREDGTVITANLPWPLSARQVEADVGLQHVHIVNDFEAVAYAAAQVDASGVLHLCGPCGSPPRTARWSCPPKPASRRWRPVPNWKWRSSATCSATARTCRSNTRCPAPA